MAFALLFFATCFLAYSNGANDNFKGVASLFGSRRSVAAHEMGEKCLGDVRVGACYGHGPTRMVAL
jgi:phosphate/sulfate permease